MPNNYLRVAAVAADQASKIHDRVELNRRALNNGKVRISSGTVESYSFR